jgi:PKD repeat protein
MGAPTSFILVVATTATSGIGSYTILIEEKNDDNDGSNADSTTRSVTLYQKNLVASFLLSVDTAEKTVNLGQQVAYSFSIENKGSTPDTYSIGVTTPPVGWQAVLDKTSITVNQLATGTFTLTVSAPALYTAGSAKSISPQISAQSQASAASQALSIKATIGLADLKVTRQDLSLSTIDPEVGQTVSLKARITNDGTIAASNVVVRFSIEGTKVNDATIDTIPAGGASAIASVSWKAIQGSLTMSVSVDPDASIPEFVETDNTATLPFVVRASDITLSSTDITVTPASINAGDTVTIGLVVHNTGTANASIVKVKLSIGTFTKDQNIDKIVKNSGSATINFTWTAVSGSQVVQVVLDPDNTIAEINENNNNAEKALTVNKPPVAAINTTALKPKVGDVVTFSSTGSADPDGTISSYYFDFGDGSNSGWVATPSVSHTYATTGTYTAKLKVKDNSGAESTDMSMVITVEKKPAKKTPGFEFGLMLMIVGLIALVNKNKWMRRN